MVNLGTFIAGQFVPGIVVALDLVDLAEVVGDGATIASPPLLLLLYPRASEKDAWKDRPIKVVLLVAAAVVVDSSARETRKREASPKSQ